MPSPPHPRLRNRHSLPPAVSNGAHPSDYAARELWTAIPCDSLEYRRVVPTSESPSTRPERIFSRFPHRESGWLALRAEPVRKGPAARRRRSSRPSLARFRPCVALSEGGFSSVGHLDPLRVRRGLGLVVVVPVPPLVRRGLGVTLWRVLPGLLTTERRHIEVAPGGSHRLVAAAVDEVCAEHPLAVADECIVAVPLVDAEVQIEAVGDGVPRHLPAHACLQARDVRLLRA